MGTNYYLVNQQCECCKRYDRAVHLGKSSGGWTFSFRGYKQQWAEEYKERLNVQTFAEWQEMVESKLQDGYTIKDEYGADESYENLLDLIERKRHEPNNHSKQFADDINWLYWRWQPEAIDGEYDCGFSGVLVATPDGELTKRGKIFAQEANQ